MTTQRTIQGNTRIYKFNELSDLRALSGQWLNEGDMAVFTGTQGSDGTENVYLWNATSTDADDNATVKLTDTTTGRFKAIPLSGFFNVNQYAPAGDAATDDAVELQGAIDATPSGGRLRFNPGVTYKCDSTLTITKPIHIDGYGAEIDFSGLAAGIGLDLQTSNWSIKGIKLTGPGNSSYASGSIAVNCTGTNNSPSAPTYYSDYRVEDCEIDGWGDAGLYFRYGQRVWVLNNKIVNIGYSGIGSWAMTEFTYGGNHIEGMKPGTDGNSYNIICSRFMDAAYSETAEPRCSRGKIINNTLLDNPLWEAIDSKGGEQMLIHGNYIKGVYRGMILASSQDGTGGGAEDLAFRDSTISNNILIATSESDSGTHDGSSGSTTTMTDSTKNWTANEWAGYRVHNSTDGSSAEIASNTSDTLTFTGAGLTLGSENDFDTGDAYVIRRYGEGIHIQGAFNAAQNAVVQYASNNRVVNNYLYEFGINNNNNNGAITLDGTKNTVVDGNTIIQPIYAGVLTSIFNTGWHITNNFIKDPFDWDLADTSCIRIDQRTNTLGHIEGNIFAYETSTLPNVAAYSIYPIAELTGNHDGASSGTLLDDSGATFSVDQLIGGVVRNTTDGSWGRITDNDGTTVTATLTDGTDNTWDPAAGGDAYAVSGISVEIGRNFYRGQDATHLTLGNILQGGIVITDDYKESGVVNITTSTSGNEVTATVTFKRRFPLTPRVFVQIVNDQSPGGDLSIAVPTAITATGFVMRLLTVDGGNFATEETDKIAWEAKVISEN